MKTGAIRKEPGTNKPKGDGSQTSIFKIKLTGTGGHGSTPHKLIDVISGAIQVFEALHTIVSRNVDSSKDVTVMVGRVQSGSIYNVFPDHAFIEGQIKTFDRETHALVEKRVKEIVINTGAAMECKAEVEFSPKP